MYLDDHHRPVILAALHTELQACTNSLVDAIRSYADDETIRLRGEQDNLVAAIAAVQEAASGQAQGVDFPDSIGYWAFKGYRRINFTGKQELATIFEVTKYTDCLDEEESPYPAIVIGEDRNSRIWHGKYYPEPPEGIGGVQYVGAFYKLTMPWERQPAPVGVVPDWSTAPSWAWFWTVDRNGARYWWEAMPKPDTEEGIWDFAPYIGPTRRAEDEVSTWLTSMQQRPGVGTNADG